MVFSSTVPVVPWFLSAAELAWSARPFLSKAKSNKSGFKARREAHTGHDSVPSASEVPQTPQVRPPFVLTRSVPIEPVICQSGDPYARNPAGMVASRLSSLKSRQELPGIGIARIRPVGHDMMRASVTVAYGSRNRRRPLGIETCRHSRIPRG